MKFSFACILKRVSLWSRFHRSFLLYASTLMLLSQHQHRPSISVLLRALFSFTQVSDFVFRQASASNSEAPWPQAVGVLPCRLAAFTIVDACYVCFHCTRLETCSFLYLLCRSLVCTLLFALHVVLYQYRFSIVVSDVSHLYCSFFKPCLRLYNLQLSLDLLRLRIYVDAHLAIDTFPLPSAPFVAYERLVPLNSRKTCTHSNLSLVMRRTRASLFCGALVAPWTGLFKDVCTISCCSYLQSARADPILSFTSRCHSCQSHSAWHPSALLIRKSILLKSASPDDLAPLFPPTFSINFVCFSPVKFCLCNHFVAATTFLSPFNSFFNPSLSPVVPVTSVRIPNS